MESISSFMLLVASGGAVSLSWPKSVTSASSGIGVGGGFLGLGLTHKRRFVKYLKPF